MRRRSLFQARSDPLRSCIDDPLPVLSFGSDGRRLRSRCAASLSVDRWTPEEGVLDPPVDNGQYRGLFVPGKDVRVPWNSRALVFHWSEERPNECTPGKPQAERNRTVLLWEGSVRRPRDAAAVIVHNSRMTLVDRFRGYPGCAAPPGAACRRGQGCRACCRPHHRRL